MILTERIITVNGNISTLDAPIYLYQGDKNVDIYFSIVNPKYKFSKKVVDNLLGETAAYFDLYIIKPDGSQVSFKNQAIEDKKAKWTIESELIDEEIEIGKYDFQIRLLDENKTSILTIPPLLGQLEILKPIYTDSDTPSNNLVNLAATNYALATSGNNDVVVFDEDGNYVATVWTDKMKITDTLLNKIETAIKQNTAQYKDIASKIENGNIGNNVEPQLMDMPRIYFSEGTLPTSKTATVMKFDYYSKTATYHGYVDIKCQGNSSMAYPKKNFTIKSYIDKTKTNKLKIDFKGWGKQNKFVLKANWIDITHARNVVSARLWGDIIKTRADYATALPELLRTSPNQGAIDGFPVLVYSNGVYQGRYTLNIPKDKWMSNMDDALDTHCILCGENYVSGCFRALPQINGTDWTDELHDVVPATIKTSWTNAIKFVMNSTDAEFKANLGNYFDVNSLIDYYIYGLVATNLDGFGKNQLFFCYDGIHWIASVYDMDSTWGLYWNGSRILPTNYARNQYEDYVNKTSNLLYNRLEQLYMAQLKTRYAELRKDVLSASHIIQKFEEFNDVCPKDIVQEDYASTTGAGKFTGMPSLTTNNIQQLRNNIVGRLTYVDGYINALQVATPCTNITLNNTVLTFTTDAAQTLTATVTPTDTTDTVTWSVNPTGICTVNNGVVTPINNGQCTITAKCGSHSATCNVTVNLPVQAVTALSLDKDSITLGNTTETDDSAVNYLEGATWKNGQYKIEGFKENGNNKVTSVTVPYAGIYHLNYTGSLNLTFQGFGEIDSTGKIIGWYPENVNEHVVFKPNTLLGISFYPNGNPIPDEEYSKFELKRVKNLNNVSKDIEVSLDKCNKPDWAKSTTDINIVEINYGESYDIFAIQVGDTIFNYPYNYAGGNNDATNIATLKNLNSLNTFSVVQLYIELPLSINTYGTTIDDFKSYMTYNNKKIIINPSEYINSLQTTYSKYEDVLSATLTPTNATNKNVTWTASNENVQLVANGLECTVKAKAVGDSIVTCTSQDTTNGTITDTCNVTVTDVSAT